MDKEHIKKKEPVDQEHKRKVWRKNQKDKIDREKAAGFTRKTVKVPVAYVDELFDFVHELNDRWLKKP